MVDAFVFDTSRNAYLNVKMIRGNWLIAFRNIKARIDTTAPRMRERFACFQNPGTGCIRSILLASEESVVLYIDNNPVQSDINTEITMEGVGTLGECAFVYFA